jgi:hypothetical protein
MHTLLEHADEKEESMDDGRRRAAPRVRANRQADTPATTQASAEE